MAITFSESFTLIDKSGVINAKFLAL